jgi:GTP-binding protein
VDEVVAAILAAGQQHRRRVSTATLNLVLREAVAWKAPPSQRGNGRQGRIYYTTQAGSSPPSFVMFVNDPRLFSDDYRRCVAFGCVRLWVWLCAAGCGPHALLECVVT